MYMVCGRAAAAETKLLVKIFAFHIFVASYFTICRNGYVVYVYTYAVVIISHLNGNL